jgi:hypothetical protein
VGLAPCQNPSQQAAGIQPDSGEGFSADESASSALICSSAIAKSDYMLVHTMAQFRNHCVPLLSFAKGVCLRAVPAFYTIVGDGWGGARYSPAQLLALGFSSPPLKCRIAYYGIEWLAGGSENPGRGYDHRPMLMN